MDDERSSVVVPATATLSNVRVTELDVNKPFSFFAQIGTNQELASFDEYSASLSAWCGQQRLGITDLPLVGAYLAVWSNKTWREDEGWFRAYVTKHIYNPRQVECKLFDIGATQLVQLSNVCNQNPPMMYSMAAQALYCTLADAVELTGSDAWSAKAISRFKELATNEHTKQAVVLSQQSDSWLLSIVIKMPDGWTSLGRLLAEDNLATYVPSQLVLQAIDTLNSQCPVHPPPAIFPNSSFSSSDEQPSSPVHDPLPGSPHHLTVLADVSSSASDKQPLLPVLDTLPGPTNKLADTRSDEQPLSQIMSDLTHKDSDNESNNNSVSVSLNQSVDTDKHESVKVGNVGEKAVKSVNSPMASSIDPKQKFLPQPFKKMMGVTMTEKLPPAQVAAASIKGVVMKEKVEHKVEKHEDQASTSAAVQVNVVTKDKTKHDEEKQACATAIPKDVDTKELDHKKERVLTSATSMSVVVKERQEEPASSISSCTDVTKRKETVDKPDCDQEPSDESFQADSDLSSNNSPCKGSGLSPFEVQRQRKRANLHACFTALMTESNTSETTPSYSQHQKSYDQGSNTLPPTNVNLSFSFPKAHDDEYSTGNHSGRGTGTRQKQGKWGRRRWNDLGRHWLPRERQLASVESTSFGYQQQPPSSNSPLSPSPAGSSMKDLVVPAQPRVAKQDLNNEVEWLSRMILTETNKILSAGFISGQFMGEIKKVLSGPPAQKLSALTGSSGPVQSVLKALLLNVMKEPSRIEAIVQAIVLLHDHSTDDVSSCLQSVLEKESKGKQFCTILAKLYFTSLNSETLFPLVGAVVRHFLDTWVKCAPEADEQTSIADALLFAELCEEIGPTLDTSSREILDEYFEKTVRENILQGLLPRSVREIMLDLTSKRSAWIVKVQQTGLDNSQTACPPQSIGVTSQEFSTPCLSSHASSHKTPDKPGALALDTQLSPYDVQSHSPAQGDSTQSAQAPFAHSIQSLPAHGTQSHPLRSAQGDSTHSAESLSTYSDPTHHSVQTPQGYSHHCAVTPPYSTQCNPIHSAQSYSAQDHPYNLWAQSPRVDQSLPAYSTAESHHSAQNPLHYTQPLPAHSSQDYQTCSSQPYTTEGYLAYSTPSLSVHSTQPLHAHSVQSYPVYEAPSSSQSMVAQGSQPSYRKVNTMLQELNLMCFSDKFQTCLIKDPQLQASRDDLKSTLREAGIPSGAILAILQYLNEKESETTREPISRPLSPAVDHSQWSGSQQDWNYTMKYH